MAYHSKVIKGGKVALPASIRRDLGMGEGEPILIDQENGRVIIRTWAQVVEDVQAMTKPYALKGGSAVDELIAGRRAEAQREDEEARRWLDERRK